MIPLLRAEYRKLFTIRSTYILCLVALLLSGFISFWVMGHRAPVESPWIFMEVANTAAGLGAMFLSIIAILLVAHEYRYNTIMYTLTSANSRTKVLLAKIISMSSFAIAFTVFSVAFGVFLSWLGITMSGKDVVPQQFFYWDTAWRSLYFVLAYTLVGLMLSTLVRHVVGAIVTLLIVPSTIEGLLTLVLKSNGKYLPFTALDQVNAGAVLKPHIAALIFTAYLAVGWVIAWWLFLRRDAN